MITRPNHDLTTTYLSAWARKIAEIAQEKGFFIYDLEGVRANVKTFLSFLKEKSPSFLFLNGHGSPSEICGQRNEVIMDSTTEIPGAIIYARSCSAGIRLGEEAIKNGARAFIGYARNFIVGYSPDKVFEPLTDDMASLFLDPSNLVASVIIKGHSAAEANTRSKEAMYKNFRKMILSTATYEERYASQWLWSNLKGQILLGDPDAKI